jgi:general secretion pathway protein L
VSDTTPPTDHECHRIEPVTGFWSNASEPIHPRMSVLVLLIPPRPRGAAPAAADFEYVLSADGRSAGTQGRAAAALLPRASRVVAVVGDADIAWHRIKLPKAPPGRMRAALAGVMEDALLDDEESLHFALAPQAAAGEPAWVAVMHKRWLAGVLAALQAAGVEIDALLPASAPGDAAHGHFGNASADASGELALQLVHSGPDGVRCLRLAGTLPRALLAQWASAEAGGPPTRWTAAPAAAEAATHWLGAPLAVLTEGERALEAAAGGWDLRQFDLAPRHRGVRALRDTARRLASPAWRPVRVGLALLAAVHLAGVNAWAWQQQRLVEDKQAASVGLLRSTHPQVRAVLDALLQMERETALLRAAAGQPGVGDFEVMVGAAAAAWPEGAGPVQTLRYEPGRLTLGADDWDDARAAAFAERLRATGWAVEAADGRYTVSRGGGR